MDSVVALSGDRAIAAYRDVGDKMNVVYRDGYDRNVTLIDSSGKATGKSYKCRSNNRITGLIYYQPWIYITEEDGTITKIREDLDPNTASVANVKSDQFITKTRKDRDPDMPSIVKVVSGGFIYPGDVIQEDLILLSYITRGTVFTYDMKTKKEEIKITDLIYPVHVLRHDMKSQSVYVVTEHGGFQIQIYNSDWNLMKKFGREGREDGELLYPECTVLPNGDLLVADAGNNRISQFNQDSVFVKHLITWIDRPRCMSFRDSMLWVMYGPANERRIACYGISGYYYYVIST